MKINEWPRHGIQALWAFITNSHVTGFVTGKIYTGKLKNACVPGLNCYSCPGAVGACPIGSLQAVIGSWNFKMAYYVVGFLIFIGAMVGRLICGFLCPFGLIQDLLNKIPFPKKIRTFKGDKLLRKLKYVIFAVFVILLPLFLVDIMGQGAPYFCKLICPAGTLEGGLPLVLLNKAMRGAIGYTAALTKHLINKTNDTDIVKQQKADETVDVFTGLPFKTEGSEPDAAEKAADFFYRHTCDRNNRRHS